MPTDNEVWRNIVEQRKRKAFSWPYEQSVQAVSPVTDSEPPMPTPKEEPPSPVSADKKNIASRMLAEGLNLPETNIRGEGVPTQGLSPSPQATGDMGKMQSMMAQKNKN